MEDNDTQSIVKIANEVTNYLVNHPNAMDSLEGITTWWLTHQRYNSALNIVQSALDMLVESETIVKSSVSGNKVVYSLRLKIDE